MSRILDIDRAKATPQQAAILKEVDKWGGRGATPFKIWIHNPEVAAGMETLSTHFKASPLLSHAEVELVILATTVFWKIPYAIANHVKHGRAAGLPEDALEAIVAGKPASFADPRLQAVNDMARAALAGGAVDDAVFAGFQKTLGRDGIAEVLALIGFYTSVSLGLQMHGV